MTKASNFFGTDGMRGCANQFPMTAEIALRLGQAAGRLFRRGQHRHRVVIGKDTRLSGYMIESALVAGTVSAGMDAFLTGPLPSPAVAFLTRSLRADLGLMITASHNEYRDNGIKLFGPDGLKLSDARQSELEALMAEPAPRLARPESIGTAKRIDDASARYIEFAKQAFPKQMSLEAMRLVVDCANGAAYRAAPAALRELGADVVAMGDAPNGRNINRNCGATAPERMAAATLEAKANLGIAFDGDADRVCFADEKGNSIDGDQILACLASHWHKQGRLTKNTLVATIASNSGLARFLEGEGIALIHTRIGDRYVSECMEQHGLSLGGERSGHIVCRDYTTAGDGLIAALQILSLLCHEEKPASELCAMFEPVPYATASVAGDASLLELASIKDALAKAEKKLGKHGRLLVRPSGTEPVLRILGESEDEAILAQIIAETSALLEKSK